MTRKDTEGPGWGGGRGGGGAQADRKKRQAEADECIEADRYMQRYSDFLFNLIFLYDFSGFSVCSR